MTRYLALAVLMVYSSGLYGQEATSAFADLQTAKQITVNKSYSFPVSPKGFGLLKEFSKDAKRSEYYFEEERNTIWLLIDIPFNGILTFEVKPHSVLDDYDWMLFQHNSLLKEEIKKGTAKLLRSNNSRNDRGLKGKTGIKEGSVILYEKPGLGKSYSKPLAVKVGQKLALLIDNIYNGGSGFDFSSELKPQVLSTRMLSGTILDKNTLLPLSAKVVCEDDSTGFRLGEVVASKTGNYSLEIPADRSVNVTATQMGYMFQTVDLKADKRSTEQHFSLAPIIEGEQLLLFNIHFIPDKDVIRFNSEPELQRLTDLLKQEKGWQIRIIGHTNNNPFADARYLQKLSFNRSLAVKQYLVKNGISEKRVSCVGVGGKYPLVPIKNIDSIWKNLRVEVVLSK